MTKILSKLINNGSFCFWKTKVFKAVLQILVTLFAANLSCSICDLPLFTCQTCLLASKLLLYLIFYTLIAIRFRVKMSNLYEIYFVSSAFQHLTPNIKTSLYNLLTTKLIKNLHLKKQIFPAPLHHGVRGYF